MKNSRFKILLAILTFGLLLNSIEIFGQSGPAGVGSIVNSRIWLDANTINLIDGAPIPNCQDYSGNSSTLSQGNLDQRPLFIKTGINGLFTARFDDVNDVINSGGFQWYDGSDGTVSIPEITKDGLIATGQAAWIFTFGTGTITYRQSNKVGNDATDLREPIEDKKQNVTVKENASTYYCTIYLEEYSCATDGAESDLDIRHLSSPILQGPSIAMNMDETLTLLCKNHIAANGRDKSFKLLTEVKKEGLYSRKLGKFQTLPTHLFIR